MIEKARVLDVDQVVIDLEDSVPPEAKDDARSQAVLALTTGNWRAPSLALRVNAIESPWFDDDVSALASVPESRLGSVVAPKIECAETLERVDAALTRVGHDSLSIEALIENARGLVNVEGLTSGSPRLRTLIFGPADYAASLGIPQLEIGASDARYPGDQWHYARARIAVAAAAQGLHAIDGPFAAFPDLEGFRATAAHARLLGFDGKWVIHPTQIEICNDVFSPTAQEVEWARNVLVELDRVRGTRGASTEGGAMIDEASRKIAAQIVARSVETLN